MDLPRTRLSRRIEGFVRTVGDLVSWLWLALLAVVVLNVLLRYAFGEGRVEFEEIQWHLYAVGFLVALSYAVVSDDHVRVDFLRGRMSPRLQAWVELYGILLLVVPFVALVLVYSLPFVASSWQQAEVSAAPGGLPYRWAIKGTMPIAFALLLLAALARLARVWAFLFGVPAVPSETEADED